MLYKSTWSAHSCIVPSSCPRNPYQDPQTASCTSPIIYFLDFSPHLLSWIPASFPWKSPAKCCCNASPEYKLCQTQHLRKSMKEVLMIIALKIIQTLYLYKQVILFCWVIIIKANENCAIQYSQSRYLCGSEQ